MTAVDGPALYARRTELLSGLSNQALWVVALDSVEVDLGVLATAQPGLGEEPLTDALRSSITPASAPRLVVPG